MPFYFELLVDDTNKGVVSLAWELKHPKCSPSDRGCAGTLFTCCAGVHGFPSLKRAGRLQGPHAKTMTQTLRFTSQQGGRKQ